MDFVDVADDDDTESVDDESLSLVKALSLSAGLGGESGSESSDHSSGLLGKTPTFISTYLSSWLTSSMLTFSPRSICFCNSWSAFLSCGKKLFTLTKVSEVLGTSPMLGLLMPLQIFKMESLLIPVGSRNSLCLGTPDIFRQNKEAFAQRAVDRYVFVENAIAGS